MLAALGLVGITAANSDLAATLAHITI
jgi:hypothetical protein